MMSLLQYDIISVGSADFLSGLTPCFTYIKQPNVIFILSSVFVFVCFCNFFSLYVSVSGEIL